MDQSEPTEPCWRIEISSVLDRHTAEILYLEIRRLAESYGGEIKEFGIEKD